MYKHTVLRDRLAHRAYGEVRRGRERGPRGNIHSVYKESWHTKGF